jgi:hypothetical protein
MAGRIIAFLPKNPMKLQVCNVFTVDARPRYRAVIAPLSDDEAENRSPPAGMQTSQLVGPQ